jgi:sulfite exporter TauE/SafE/copper chaperone CopZ/plastocyanin
MSQIKQHTYYVKGTHCASCELIIEKTLLAMSNIKSVEASNNKGEVLINYEGERPSDEGLNKIFKKQGYIFSDKPIKEFGGLGARDSLWALVIAAIIMLGFLLLNRTGFSSLVQLNSASSLPAFFLFGVLAGLSTCAALVGGLVLSMAKQWSEVYAKESSAVKRFQPHLMFNIGRLVSYFVLGAILGVIGSKLQITLGFSALLILAVSILMILLALQMLGVKSLHRFQIGLPKFMTRYVADEKNFQGKYMPFVLGAATFFLPCGFTITAQGLALISGGWLSGGLIMLAFALGTAPVLLGIGLSSLKLVSNQAVATRFLKAAGFLVLFFALFNANNQLNVLGLPSFNDLALSSPVVVSGSSTGGSNNNGGNVTNNSSGGSNAGDNTNEKDLPSIVDGKQVIKMKASSSGYSPNYFKIRAGLPVRWEIEDVGTSGCTNAVIAQWLFSGNIPLTPGQVSVKEFTAPTKAGKYKFSCWMGMVSGIMEVVDANSSNNSGGNIANAASNTNSADVVVPSGAKGCGCGGGQ